MIRLKILLIKKLPLLLLIICSSSSYAEKQSEPSRVIATTQLIETHSTSNENKSTPPYIILVEQTPPQLMVPVKNDPILKLEETVKAQTKLIADLNSKIEELGYSHVIKSHLGDLKSDVKKLKDEKSYFSYADWAVIGLTCVAVLITVFGVGIAMLSFWGFKNLKNSTEELTKSIANDVAQKTVKEETHNITKIELENLIAEGKLNAQLENAVDIVFLRNKGSSNWNDFGEYPEVDEDEEDS